MSEQPLADVLERASVAVRAGDPGAEAAWEVLGERIEAEGRPLDVAWLRLSTALNLRAGPG